MEILSIKTKIPADFCGMRFDAALSKLLPDYSRAQIIKWIKLEHITIDGLIAKPKFKVKGFETIELNCPLMSKTDLEPQELELDINYEDEHLLVLNKRSDWVVHPGAGNPDQTVVNALLFYKPDLEKLPRAGIVHRLDKDTTGLLIVAKTMASYHALVKIMQERKIQRYYQAIVYGELYERQTIDTFIARHPTARTRMAVTNKGKQAITHFTILKNYKSLTHIEVKLETGRTHQIRVHLTHIGHPLVGDQTYISKNPQKIAEYQLQHKFDNFKRQVLHAYKLEFIHPMTNELISLTQELPSDMLELIEEISRIASMDESEYYADYFEEDEEY